MPSQSSAQNDPLEQWTIMDRLRLVKASVGKTSSMVNLFAYEDAMREVLDAEACLRDARERIQAVLRS